MLYLNTATPLLSKKSNFVQSKEETVYQQKLREHWAYLERTGQPLLTSTPEVYKKEIDETFKSIGLETPAMLKHMLKTRSRQNIEEACLKQLQIDPHIQLQLKAMQGSKNNIQPRYAGSFNPGIFGFPLEEGLAAVCGQQAAANLQSMMNLISQQAMVYLQQYIHQVPVYLASAWSMVSSFVIANGWAIVGINFLAVCAFAAAYWSQHDLRYIMLASSFAGAAAGATFGSAIAPGVGTVAGAVVGWALGLGTGVVAYKV
eukprot:gene5652-6348_t